jgi:hypothetical protein
MLSAGGFCDLKAKAPHGVPSRPSFEVRRGGRILVFLHEAHMLCCFFVFLSYLCCRTGIIALCVARVHEQECIVENENSQDVYTGE